MKKAGCVFINYGIESMDNQILKNMNKGLSTDQIVKGIKATLAMGISPSFHIIFSNIGENEETLNKWVEFLLEYDDGAQLRTIRPVTPYPGSPLYYQALKEGHLKVTRISMRINIALAIFACHVWLDWASSKRIYLF